MERRDFLKYVAASALAGGCGRYLPGENVLEIANLQPPAAQVPINQVMWRAVERFREAYPDVQVEPASGGGGGYQELMIRVMEGHPPDIMSFATAETGLTYAYVEQGHVLDITEHLQRPSWDTPGNTWLETIDPLYRGPLMYKGRFYAIPQNVISLQVYCNAELYQRAGADLNPQTWDQFLDNCERLKRAGIVPITQDGIHWYTSWWFDHLAQRILGADKVRQAFRDPQRRTPWTESGFLQAARMIEQMLDRGYFAEGFAGLNHIESELLFWQRRAATVFVGSWFTSGRTAVIGKDFPLYAFRFPAVQDGRGNPHDLIGTVNTQSIPALARQPELAAGISALGQQPLVPRTDGTTGPDDQPACRYAAARYPTRLRSDSRRDRAVLLIFLWARRGTSVLISPILERVEPVHGGARTISHPTRGKSRKYLYPLLRAYRELADRATAILN